MKDEKIKASPQSVMTDGIIFWANIKMILSAHNINSYDYGHLKRVFPTIMSYS